MSLVARACALMENCAVCGHELFLTISAPAIRRSAISKEMLLVQQLKIDRCSSKGSATMLVTRRHRTIMELARSLDFGWWPRASRRPNKPGFWLSSVASSCRAFARAVAPAEFRARWSARP